MGANYALKELDESGIQASHFARKSLHQKRFIFNHTFGRGALYDFEDTLRLFDWTLTNQQVLIDLSGCQQANYQALSLLVLYVWQLRIQGCYVVFKFGKQTGASKMWRLMGATGWSQVLKSSE